ncbi:flagellar protein FlaG [Bacillus sp. AK031]
MIDKVAGLSVGIHSYNSSTSKSREISDSEIQNKAEGQQRSPYNQEPTIKEKLDSVVRGMNEFLSSSNTHLKFEFHEKLKDYYVTIIDDTTKEVVKEIPSKKVLDMHAAMKEFIGLMIDKKI